MTLGTSPQPEGLTKPPLHELMNHADSKYALLIFGAKRAKQINDYFLQIKEGLLNNVGPLVPYVNNEQPLSIAFREINEGLIEGKLGSEDNTESHAGSKVISDSISLSAEDLVGSDNGEDDIDDEEEEKEEEREEEEEGEEDIDE
ncbi:MAG: DNA-directed RNA polymerase subunit omega [Aeriscardovia sp.]|nr:DNA-directed RNA polymerase subunit omega [Aeriscardovia sp.]